MDNETRQLFNLILDEIARLNLLMTGALEQGLDEHEERLVAIETRLKVRDRHQLEGRLATVEAAVEALESRLREAETTLGHVELGARVGVWS